MGNERKKLLDRPSSEPIGFWNRIKRSATGWAPTIATPIIIFNAVSTGLEWIFRSREYAFNGNYIEGLATGSEDAMVGKKYAGNPDECYTGNNKIQQVAEEQHPDTGGGAFGFACAVTVSTVLAYSLAFQAGYAEKTSIRISLLCSAFIAAGVDISMSIIAYWATGEQEREGFEVGYHNGYVRTYCGEFDCENLPENNTFPTSTYGGELDVPKHGGNFFGNAGVMVPLAAVSSLAVILLAFRHGQSVRQGEKPQPVGTFRMT